MKLFSMIASSSLVLGSALFLTGCASGSASKAGSDTMQENAVQHTVSAADIAATHSKEPITADSVTLLVNGLGCPQCATNIDKTLENVKGVQSVQVDLSTGKVLVGLVGRQRPSAHRLSEAVTDAGLTLVKIIQ
jgi:copper chaperone CopZ